MDLARAGCKPIVGAVQGEGNTRALEIDLYDKGVAWELPAGATAAVAFAKPDGTKGLYDKLPDGSAATTISGSTVTAILAPQALTCAGTVLASVVFYDKDMDTLATFPFKITVEANPAAGKQISNNYYYLQNLEQVNAAYADILTRLDALKIEAGTEVPANAAQMKALTIGGETFEVVDKKARQETAEIKEWFNGVGEVVENLLTMQSYEDFNGLAITPLDAITNKATGTPTSSGNFCFAKVETSKMTVGRAYTVGVKPNFWAEQIKITGSSDDVWYTGTLCTLNGISSLSGGESFTTFEFTEDMASKTLIGVSIYMSANVELNGGEICVAMVEGDTFPGWDAFYGQETNLPKSLAECATLDDLAELEMRMTEQTQQAVGDIADWMAVPTIKAIENLVSMKSYDAYNGVKLTPADAVSVSIDGTITSASVVCFASVEASKLEVGKTYTVGVKTPLWTNLRINSCDDNHWFTGALLDLNDPPSADGGEAVTSFVFTEAMKAKKYIGISGHYAVNSVPVSACVAMVEGEVFPGWGAFFDQEAPHPKNLAECATKEDLENISPIMLSADASLRFAVATDIHWTDDDSANTGMDGYEKTQLLVNSVNAEHHKLPLDFLLITGDICENKAELVEFKEKFLWQFEMPVILFAGNHDIMSAEEWREITGFNRQTSMETEDFYFIFCDTFGDNAGKTWLSHWSAHYGSADEQAYITCAAGDSGALLVGTDIPASSVTPIMRGWSDVAVVGNYVKKAPAKDADMYAAPSLDYVQKEVAKAGGKHIVFVSHQILVSQPDGDTDGVIAYLNSLDNFLFYLEGHAHVYYDSKDNASGKWTLNSGHFYKPNTGWDAVAATNYMGFRIIEIEDSNLVTYKVQPTQCVGTAYEHTYDIVNEKTLFAIEKNPRAEIDLRKVSKDKEFAHKLRELDQRMSALEKA
jgi:hypothetical protein